MARYTKSEAMEWARDGLRGQWTTLMTPFTPDDEIDEAALRSNIEHVRSLGTSGAGFTWGMGEFWSFTHDERTRVYDVAAEASAGEWPIAAHVTHTSAKEASSARAPRLRSERATTRRWRTPRFRRCWYI